MDAGIKKSTLSFRERHWQAGKGVRAQMSSPGIRIILKFWKEGGLLSSGHCRCSFPHSAHSIRIPYYTFGVNDHLGDFLL